MNFFQKTRAHDSKQSPRVKPCAGFYQLITNNLAHPIAVFKIPPYGRSLKINQHTLTPEAVSVSQDRMRVFLKMPQMKTGYVTHIVLNRAMLSDQGQPIFSGECWYNLNEKPAGSPGEVLPPPSDAIALGKITEDKISRVEALHKTFCASCHSIDGKKIVGPSFKGMFGKKQSVKRGGKELQITVDEEYIRRAILDPAAEYPQGFQPIMPQTLSESFSKEDTEKLVKWIMSLK